LSTSPDRGDAGDKDAALRWEALLRGAIITTTTQRFYSLIGMVDQKGQGIILLNSLIIPIALSRLGEPLLKFGVLMTIGTAILTIFTAIMAIYPKRRAGAKPDGSLNLLHFADIGQLKEDEFLRRFNPVFNDPERLSAEAVKDMHDISRRILMPKYRWLKIAYITFFAGNLVAIAGTLYFILSAEH